MERVDEGTSARLVCSLLLWFVGIHSGLLGFRAQFGFLTIKPYKTGTASSLIFCVRDTFVVCLPQKKLADLFERGVVRSSELDDSTLDSLDGALRR